MTEENTKLTELIAEILNSNQVLAENIIKKLNKKIIDAAVEQKRYWLSESVNQHFKSIVKYGPFKGFKFSSKSWWGKDRASMILGMYEKEILNELVIASKNKKYFIDIGAAEGYYAAGVLFAKLYEKAWCYEISPAGRAVILDTSLINNVLDRITINAAAKEGFECDFNEEVAANSVVLIDVEGFEFSLLTDGFLEKFRKSIIIIELHEWFYPDGSERLKAMKDRIEEYFKISEIFEGDRGFSNIPELDLLSDTNKWLVCSEGRARKMRWWRLDPRK